MPSALDHEILRRVNDGWDVARRTPTEVEFVHAVQPPWWRILADIPVMILTGGGPTHDVRRTMRVSLQPNGTLVRHTVGDIPPSWRRPRPWEVADGSDDRA